MREELEKYGGREEFKRESLEEIDKEIEEIEKKIKELREKGKEVKLPPTEQGTVIPKPNVEKAVKVYNDDKEIGMISLWEDGKVTACISDKEGVKGGCYTVKDGGERFFYIVQAWVAGLSDKVKFKPVEEQ